MSTKATTNVVKTTILVVVASLLAAGVYFGISRINSKPPVAPSNNQFVEDLDELVNKMSATMDGVEKDGASAGLLSSIGDDYAVFSHKLQLYRDEQLIDASEYDGEVDNLNGSFAQKYANYYLNRFKTSEWGAADINNIRIMVKDLTSFSKSNSTLSELVEIINVFDQAALCANSVECRTMEAFKSKTASAKGFINNEYIAHNPTLCSQLRSLPRRLAENHYEYIEQRVASLSPRNYRAANGGYLNKDKYEDDLGSVEREINNYEQNRSVYGNEAPSTQEIRRQLSRYREDVLGQ